MRLPHPLLLLLVLLPGASSRAHAASAFIPVTPAHPDRGGLSFRIAAARSAEGGVTFDVLITPTEAELGRKVSAQLSVVRVGPGTWSGRAVRPLPVRRRGRSVACAFTVPKKSLGNPGLCFVFTNYAQIIRDGKVIPMPSADFYYARLRDFAGR